MTTSQEPDTDISYDVQLRGALPEPAYARRAGVSMCTTGTQTVLRCRVSSSLQLDALLHTVGALGLVLLSVHRHIVLRPGSVVQPDGGGGGTGPDTYEIRVEGELGDALLRHLGCCHYVVPEQTLVRIRATADELHRFLRACTDSGAVIECVSRTLATHQGRTNCR